MKTIWVHLLWVASWAAAAPPLLSAETFDHIGVVVNDTISTAELWAGLFGIEAPTIFDNAGPEGNITFHGVPTDANIVGAYIGCNPLAGIELLQPGNDTSFQSFWLDHLRLFGSSPGYVGFATDDWTETDLSKTAADFSSSGCPTDQQGYWWQDAEAGQRGCYRYMNCRSTPFGSTIEIMTRTNCVERTDLSAKPARQILQRIRDGEDVPTRAAANLNCSAMLRLSLVVPNVTETTSHFAAMFSREEPSVQSTQNIFRGIMYKGEATNATALWTEFPLRNGQGSLDFALRIIQPEEKNQRSWWRDGLRRYGPSVNLLTFGVPDVDSVLSELAEYGFTALQKGDCTEGGSFAYIDSLDKLGLVVEVTNCS